MVKMNFWKRKAKPVYDSIINPLHIYISTHFLLTDHLAFVRGMTTWILFDNQELLKFGDHFLYSYDLNILFRSDTVKRN